MYELQDELLYRYLLNNLRQNPILAKNYTHINGEKLNYRDSFSTLKKYVNSFINDGSENNLIIMPGLRGVGKTTLLFQLYEYLIKEKGVLSRNVLYLTIDDLRNKLNVNIAEALEFYVEEVLMEKSIVELEEKLFVFIDEAQYDPDWSLNAKIIHDKSKNIFLILTGSSALDLENSPDTERRSIKEYIHPLNFREYLFLNNKFHVPFNTSKSVRDLIFQGKVSDAIKKENNLYLNLTEEDFSLKNEWKNFLVKGGLPIGIDNDDYITFMKISGMINKVVDRDVQHLHSFREDKKQVVQRVLMYLASQKPGETSENKLSNYLDESSALIKKILLTLEKTQLIFNLKPVGGTSKKIKGWKYYFASPTLKVAINYDSGNYKVDSKEYLGILNENLFASCLNRISKNHAMSLSYDDKKGGVDFILSNSKNEKIPIEVGLGKKSKKQIKKAISTYNADYGLVISSKTDRIIKEDDVIFVPLEFASMV